MSRNRTLALAVLMLSVATGLAAAAPAAAAPQIQALPSPLRFVSNLDLECMRTSPYTPPPTTVVVRHLNPVLGTMPIETHTLGAREQLCVPVAKNNVLPPPEVLAFIKFVDLSCYKIAGANINRTLSLRHLNPQLGPLPVRTVVLTVPQQLCVPVVKNGLYPPHEVYNLVSHIDLKCYLEQPPAPMNRVLGLTHLNPVLGNLPTHQVQVTYNRQLCVPVQKSGDAIPADVMNIVRWIDLEKFDIVTSSTVGPVNLTLNHINPVLSGLPTEPATIYYGTHLMLPVSKNGVTPPA
jgi:hypothetical protein